MIYNHSNIYNDLQNKIIARKAQAIKRAVSFVALASLLAFVIFHALLFIVINGGNIIIK